MSSEYIAVKDLPAIVQDALGAVGYRRADIRTEASEQVVLSGSPGNGYRAFVVLVNLTTKQFVTQTGSWGGANMFDRTNAVDNDHNSYPLPADGVAIVGSSGGSKPVYATLHIPASMVAKLLPASPVDLTTDERNALYCHQHVRGGTYRKQEMSRLTVPASAVDSLVTRGMLSRNRAGAVQITTAGKNALAAYKGTPSS